jgi:hypothetical protein
MIPDDQGSAGHLWLRGDEIGWSDVFSIRCAALTMRVSEYVIQRRSRKGHTMRHQTVLFSFEGSDPHVPFAGFFLILGGGERG